MLSKREHRCLLSELAKSSPDAPRRVGHQAQLRPLLLFGDQVPFRCGGESALWAQRQTLHGDVAGGFLDSFRKHIHLRRLEARPIDCRCIGENTIELVRQFLRQQITLASSGRTAVPTCTTLADGLAGSSGIKSASSVVVPASGANAAYCQVNLASVPLNEPAAKIEVYAAWRKDDASATVRVFLECVRSTLVPQKQRARVTFGSVVTSYFPRTACDECSYARATKTGR